MRSEADNLTLVEHLRELRIRIMRSLYGIALGSAIAYYFSAHIMDFLRKPVEKYLPVGGLVFTAPTDKFVMILKVSLFSGLLLSAPWWLFQIWRFVAPGLYQNERRYTLSFIVTGTVLFIIGSAFAYYLAVPAAFEFLMNFGGDVDKPMITISAHLSFMITFLFMFGLAFELPLIIVMAGMMGVVNQAFLREYRRYFIVAMSVFCAIVTPPDVMSMLLMLVPMYGLFEISIFLVGFFENKRVLEPEEATEV